jgi:hypothetical protein
MHEHCEGFDMLISGTVAIIMLGGAMTALVAASIVLAIFDKHYDLQRRHWRPAESSTHW